MLSKACPKSESAAWTRSHFELVVVDGVVVVVLPVVDVGVAMHVLEFEVVALPWLSVFGQQTATVDEVVVVLVVDFVAECEDWFVAGLALVVAVVFAARFEQV